MTEPDILVLRQTVHGMDATKYGTVLRNQIPECDVVVASTPAEERELLRDATIATGKRLGKKELELAEELELFACVYAGTNHLDLDSFSEHGVAVTNAAGVHSSNVSEYVVGSMIALSHRFSRAWEQKQNREWRVYPTRELSGSTVTVVGLGAIGQAVVDRLEAFEMETIGVRYSPEKGGSTDVVYGFDEIHRAVAGAEYVVLACPLTETTQELVDADLLSTMSANAILVNAARGRVVDTDALLGALRSDAIAGAALDVTDPEPLPEDHPLWSLGNVLITPHNAGHTPEYFDRCAQILAENVQRLQSGSETEFVNQVV